MIYQNMIFGINPYVVLINKNTSYPVHAHCELELIYCLRGIIIASVDGTEYEIKEGEALCIGGMAHHGYGESPLETDQMVVEFGPMFIGEEYRYITDTPFSAVVFRNTPENSDILSSLQTVYKSKKDGGEFSSLIIKGELYRLFALILQSIQESSSSGVFHSPPPENRELISKIDNALTLVQHKYTEPLTVIDAAKACGYGVSVFCNTFKRATGISFHQYLNSKRVETAKYMLLKKDATVDFVASSVGFTDSKSFCRSFKRFVGVTPTEYRRLYSRA